MNQWDGPASTYLAGVCGDLQQEGVVDLFKDRVRSVWRRNVNGYVPSEGDTSLSLGVTCAENLRELIIGECAGDQSAWKARGVAALNVERSLRVEFRGLRLLLMKAPPSQVRIPVWNGTHFNWQQQSDVRRAAAERNSRAYRPMRSDQEGRQLTLDEPPRLDSAPDGMQALLVVWSGQIEEPLTAGWVGFPSYGVPAWYAVQPLWWDKPTEGSIEHRPSESTSPAGGYANLPEPQPVIKLRSSPGDPGVERR